MKAFTEYLNTLDSLIPRIQGDFIDCDLSKSIDAALDGQPARELRRLIPLENLRSSGAFFTGSKLSKHALRFLLKTIDDKSVILDPACGAGDLLIACAANLPKEITLDRTLKSWNSRIIGRDLHPEFIRATKIRLLLAASRLSNKECNVSTSFEVEEMFTNIKKGCGITDQNIFKSITHIVINPPFTLIDAPRNCLWSTGKVNSAAIFLESCVINAQPNTRIVAILPDVLRSGSRYKKWRRLIEAHSKIHQVELFGKFDSWADVDVFTLELDVKHDRKNRKSHWNHPTSPLASESVKDRFNICVGPVVDYRNPHSGQWYPFIKARNLTPWQIIQDVAKRRRFSGRVILPPFVVVRRTSGPGDKCRATGTMIIGDRPVAVENHLLVLLPKDGTAKSCRKLLTNLKDTRTSEWLNQRIRCRHLTVSSLADVPWWR